MPNNLLAKLSNPIRTREELKNLLIVNKIPNSSVSMNSVEKKTTLLKQNRAFTFTEEGALLYRSNEGSEIQLNGLATDKFGDNIWCRHLSAYLAFDTTRGVKNYHSLYGTIESIQSINFLKENEYDKNQLLTGCSYYNFFNINQLGLQLEKVARCLNAGEETTLLLASENHLMTITLMKKCLTEVKTHFVIKFYNPKFTDTHIRIICPSIESVRTLSFQTIIGDDMINAYFPHYKSATLISPKNRKGATPAVAINSHEASYPFAESSNPGFTKLFCTVFELVLIDNLDDEEKVRICSMGIFLALINGLSEVLASCIELVLQSTLSNTAKYQILAGTMGCSYPGLIFAARLSHEETVNVYLKGILNSNLSNVEKIELCLTRDKRHRISVLCEALQSGNSNMVRSYLDVILWSDLSCREKLWLAYAPDQLGLPGFLGAIVQGKYLAVSTYILSMISPKNITAKKVIQKDTAKTQKNTSQGLARSVFSFFKGTLISAPTEMKSSKKEWFVTSPKI